MWYRGVGLPWKYWETLEEQIYSVRSSVPNLNFEDRRFLGRQVAWKHVEARSQKSTESHEDKQSEIYPVTQRKGCYISWKKRLLGTIGKECFRRAGWNYRMGRSRIY